MTSWIDTGNGLGFLPNVLPYGIFSTDALDQRIGVAIGDYILDLKVLAQEKLFAGIDFDSSALQERSLNRYAALGKDVHRKVRNLLQELLAQDTGRGSELRDNRERREKALVKISDAAMHLPMTIGDYTDFFVGIYHAQNCAAIIRPGEDLPRNYTSLPVGYSGRASSVVVSETPIRRPKGQYLVENAPILGNCQKLDFEVEFAAFISQGNEMGESIAVDEAEDHIFGVVLMNDWSARDIQAWESTPLGPFNGKNFATTISPWIVPLDALEQFRVEPVESEGPILSYLQQKGKNSVYDIPIQVSLEDRSGRYKMFECNTKNVIFSFAQMLASHTVGGCKMRTGDLIATGTVSGPTRHSLGCLLEASKGGAEPYEIESIGSDGKKSSRRFLEDGDIIEFKALGFGSCKGQVLPAV